MVDSKKPIEVKKVEDKRVEAKKVEAERLAQVVVEKKLEKEEKQRKEVLIHLKELGTMNQEQAQLYHKLLNEEAVEVKKVAEKPVEKPVSKK